MKLQSTTHNNDITIKIEGRIDTTNYNEFENGIAELLEQHQQNNPTDKLTLDCSSLTYISSSGLRIFLSLYKKMLKSGGKLELTSLQPPIKEIFDISGFSSIFNIK
jgi:anti-anti-sigma factor